MELSPARKTSLYGLFALSGFCALVYEILWTKYLSLTFGTTMLAVSVVAATFMGGLALGSYLLGRYADRESNLLRIYAWLELGIALTALLFPPTLGVVERAYVGLSRLWPNLGALSSLFHFGFSALLLLPPAACMGGTFPLMCRFFARKKSGGQIGRLYALNTLGATAGAFLAGFVLIPNLGLSATGYLAIAGNLLVAAATFLLAKNIGQTVPHDVSKAKRPEQPLQARSHRLTLVAIGLVGFLSLGYEILWTRVLLLFLGNTTYAFSLMLSAYLVGIALGGAIYARKVRPNLDEKRVFVVLTTLMGLSILVTAPFYDQLAHLFQFAHEASGERWWHLSMLSFLIVFAVMCVPTVLSGSLLPAAVAILDPGKSHTGEGVGLVVLHNTVGAVLGSLIAGFVLVPIAGLATSFRLLAGINILLALVLLLRFRPKGGLRLTGPSLISLGALLAFIPVEWDQKLMNSGVYCYAPAFTKRGGIEKALANDRILEVLEGRETTVTVKEDVNTRTRFLSVNGKTDASNGMDMPTQILIGQIPLLLHPEPSEALVIGVGSGITAGSMKDYPFERFDCVEISPEVIRAARFFARENRDILNDSRMNLIIDDGRNFLLVNDRRYDIIVSQPSNPWQAGNANLFTDEFYRLGASRLKENGIFCQWIGLYDITPENLRILCRTFMQTFPKVMAFKSGPDLILIGRESPLSFDYASMRQKMSFPGIRNTLSAIDIDTPGDLIGKHFLLSDASLLNFARSAETNSDDLPILEYSFKSNLGDKTFGQFQMENMQTLNRAMVNESLPLADNGEPMALVAVALWEIARGYEKAGKNNEAAYFSEMAAKFASRPAAGTGSGQNLQKGG